MLLQKNDSKERQSPHEQNRLSGNGSTAGIKESVGHQNCGDGIDSLSAFVTARQQLVREVVEWYFQVLLLHFAFSFFNSDTIHTTVYACIP